MSKEKSIVTQAEPNRIGQPNVKFRPDDFDFIIFDKGLELIWEKALPCPCKTKGSQGFKSKCKNCGGIGWVFVNPTKSRMLVQSLDLKIQYKIWGAENPGTVSVTARNGVYLSYMDRLTVTDTESIFKQILYTTKLESGHHIAITVYPIISINSLFLFQEEEMPLKKLVEGIDFTFDYNVITLSSDYDDLVKVSLSINYTHNIQYHIVENLKDVRNTYIFDSVGKDSLAKLPVHALGKRTHNVLDIESLAGDRLYDNSYEE